MGEQHVLVPCQVGVVAKQTQPAHTQKHKVKIFQCVGVCVRAYMCVFVHSHGSPLPLVEANVVLFQSTDVADCFAPHLSQCRQRELCFSLPH